MRRIFWLFLLLLTIAGLGCSTIGVSRSIMPVVVDGTDWYIERSNKYIFKNDDVSFMIEGFEDEGGHILMGPPLVPIVPVFLTSYLEQISLILKIEASKSDLVINVYEIKIELPTHEYYSPDRAYFSFSRPGEFDSHPAPNGAFHLMGEKVRFQLLYNRIPKKKIRQAKEFVLVFGDVLSDKNTIRVPPLKYRRGSWKTYYHPVYFPGP